MNSTKALKRFLVLVLLIGLVSADTNEQCTEDDQDCVGNDHAMIQMKSAGAINKTLDTDDSDSEWGWSKKKSSESSPSIMDILSKVQELSKYADNPADALKDPALRQKALDLLKPYVMKVLSPALKVLQPYLDKWHLTPDGMVEQWLSCTTQTSCGSCTNKMALCYWCSTSQSCHPYGSQQLHFGESSPECTESNCMSQLPASSCKTAYCPDGSSVGMDDGPCGARMNCESCMKASCFWCGISGSCHQVGSQFSDPRCTNSNCQSTYWLSSCDSGKCSDAVAYEPIA